MTKKDFLFFVKLYSGCDDTAIKRIDKLCDEFLVKNRIVQTKVEYKDRIIIKETNIFGEEKATLQPIAEYLKSYCEVQGIDINDVVTKKRFKRNVRLRRDFAIAAHSVGYTFVEIGRVMKRDHTTIVHYFYHYKI